MSRTELGLNLRSKPGASACDELATALEQNKADMIAESLDRFDGRLDARLTRTESTPRQEMTTVDANLRVAMNEGFTKLRNETSEMRVDILRWSFLFWIGQVAALGSLMAVLLRAAGH